MSIACFMVELDEHGVWRRLDTGAEYFSCAQVPPGAMWYADWLLGVDGEPYMGPDGHSLVVKLPNGNEWMIDGLCANCTDPQDALRGGHKCWIRHGTPPRITVDKQGKTCGAGAGSIQCGDYHGFLRNGVFEP